MTLNSSAWYGQLGRYETAKGIFELRKKYICSINVKFDKSELYIMYPFLSKAIIRLINNAEYVKK